MLWNVTQHLPAREDFIAMLGKARSTTAEALAEAERTGNHDLLLQYRIRLADWDRIIARLHDLVRR